MADYVKVATVPELNPGTRKTVQADGKTIALFNVNGTIYALDNVCRHQGGPLGEGMLEGDIVTCPWQMWESDVRTGQLVGNSSLSVATYPVQVEGDDIKVAV